MTIFDDVLFGQQTIASNVAALGPWDWLTLIAYFGALLGIAWWVVRQKTDTSQDYFLAGRKAGWIVIGASLFASNIGSEHLVGLAGTGASDGMAMAHYELHAWCLLILGWIMVPFYQRSGVYTMPEFLERRYSPSARWFLSLMSLIAYVMTKVSVTLFAGGIVFKALFPQPVLPGIDNFWVGAVGMVLVTGIYTILGGLRAVLYTELMQTAVLLIGAVCVLLCGLSQIGGWQALKDTVHNTDQVVGYKILLSDPKNTSEQVFLEYGMEGITVEGSRHVIIKQFVRDESKTKNIAEKSDKAKSHEGLLGKKIIHVSDLTKDLIDKAEVMVINRETGKREWLPLKDAVPEKTWNELIAKSRYDEDNSVTHIPEDERVKTDHFNLWKPWDHKSYPWIGLLFGAPIVGMWYWCTDQYIVQRTLAAKDQRAARRGTIFGAYLKLTPVFLFIVPGMIAYGLAVQGKMGPEVLNDSDQAFPLLVKQVLPVGLKGLVVGGLMAALMSSLASVFNSCSTLFTMDIYQKIHPKASETQLVWIGRVATAVMVVLGIAWIPIISYMPNTLYQYLQSVQSYVAPPIFAVFFLGIFIRRVNAYGCMAGLVIGFILGMFRLTIEIMHGMNPFPADTAIRWMAETSYTYIGMFLAIICSIIIVLVSLVTPKPKDEQLKGLTYADTTDEQRKETRESWNSLDVFLTVGLIVIIIAVYSYFSSIFL